jgi:hypothetical protein
MNYGNCSASFDAIHLPRLRCGAFLWYNSRMDYELAKELKDAGFPQNRSLQYFDDDANRQIRGHSKDTTLPMDRIDSPTLEELIEACAGQFESLAYRSHNKTWTATSSQMMLGGYTFPTAAVARLWLALNKVTPRTCSD